MQAMSKVKETVFGRGFSSTQERKRDFRKMKRMERKEKHGKWPGTKGVSV